MVLFRGGGGVFSWGLIFSIHEGIWTLVMIHRPLSLYYAVKIDGNNDLGRTREKNSRQADDRGSYQHIHKNNPGLGLGVISFSIVKPS